MQTMLETPVVDVSHYPTLNQTQRFEGTSDKYQFIPTTRALDVLDDFGWKPIMVDEARTRKEERHGYQKHLVRLRHTDNLRTDEGEVTDILLYNSHTGECSFKIMAGMFRFVCSNGLVVGDIATSHRVTHRGYADELVANALDNILEQAPKLEERVEEYKQINLSHSQMMDLAEQSAAVRFDAEKFIVPMREIVGLRRGADAHNDLWTVFNRIQENVISGGFLVKNKETEKWRRCGRINAVGETVRINQELWNLADAVAVG